MADGDLLGFRATYVFKNVYDDGVENLNFPTVYFMGQLSIVTGY